MAKFNAGFTSDEFDGLNMDSLDFVESEAPLPPEVPNAPQKPSKTSCFTFVDFSPEYRRKPDAWFFQAEYETFSELFNKVNAWLKENSKWETKTVETLIYDSSTGFGQTISFYGGRQLRLNLRGVRLWLVPKQQRSSPQKIGCINVVPRLKNSPTAGPATVSSNGNSEHNNPSSPLSLPAPIFETLDEMLVRVNDLLTNKPINGKILSVETVPIPLSDDYNVDTEANYFSDVQRENQSIFILRIYFEFGTIAKERLEMIDFVPQSYTWNAPLAVPNYESFSGVLTRASQWLREQPSGLRFCSCHSVEIPLEFAFDQSAAASIENRRMFFANSVAESKTGSGLARKAAGSSQELSLKFLRIAYTRPQDDCPEHFFPPTRDPVILNCKIFVPSKMPSVASGGNATAPHYESIGLTKRKMEAWLMTTAARILGAETTLVAMPFSGSSIAASIDSCIKSNSTTDTGHFLIVYRIYLDGHYLEPPARLLPATMSNPKEENQGESGCKVM